LYYVGRTGFEPVKRGYPDSFTDCML